MEDGYLKPFQYEEPRPNLARFFLLKLNGENELLVGSLVSFHPFESDRFGILGINTVSSGITSAETERKAMLKNLSGVKDFIALSYCWGTGNSDGPPRTYRLQVSAYNYQVENIVTGFKSLFYDKGASNCNPVRQPHRDGFITIGENARNYLLDLRRRQLSTFVWIDAICIDQNNEQDKAMQIPNMRNFYSRCLRVEVWLGHPSEEMEEALQQLPSVAKILNEAKGDNSSIINFLHKVDLPPPDNMLWKALAEMFSIPWWNRLWTLQEVVLAPEADRSTWSGSDGQVVQVVFGGIQVPFKEINDLYLGLSKHGMNNWLMSRGTSPVAGNLHGLDAMREIHFCRGDGKNMSAFAPELYCLLKATRRREATQAVDKIFGLISMLTQTEIQEIGVYYFMSAHKIYVRFSKYYLKREMAEYLLNHVSTKAKTSELPSWCPNFASEEESVVLGSIPDMAGRESFNFPTYAILCAGFHETIADGKWTLPEVNFRLFKEIKNSAVGLPDTHNVWRTDHPHYISLIPDSNVIQAKGISIDVVAGFVECNPAADQPVFFSRQCMMQTLAWNDECMELISRIMPHVSWDDIGESYARTIICNRMSMQWPEIKLYDRKEKVDVLKQWTELKNTMSDLCSNEVESEQPAQQSMEERKRINEEELHLVGDTYAACLHAMSRRRRFFITKSGLFGMGPSDTQVGDEVVVFFFGPTPFLIRKKENGNWMLIGECYLHGYMYGRALDEFEANNLERTWLIE